MIIRRINLQNFRNYEKKTFEFSEGVSLIVGDNAVGKTNLLEAIYLLASGRSFRVKSVEREMIRYGEEIARVNGIIQNSKIKNQNDNSKLKIHNDESYYIDPDLRRDDSGKVLEIVLTTGEVGGEKAGKKKYVVDGVPKRGFDFLGNFRAVCFGPEDLELITDSPSLRRKYLDSVLVQVDREYARCLLAYEKGIRARNKLLEGIREEGRGGDFIRRPLAETSPMHIGEGKGDALVGTIDENYRRRLYFWDQLVIKNGGVLTEKRGKYIDFLNDNLLMHLTGLDADNTDKLYADNADIPKDAFSSFNSYFCIEYDKSLISEDRLKQYEREEIASATTLVGPHRDDFVVKIKNQKSKIKNNEENNYIDSDLHRNDSGRDLSVYGSRGEQRLAILWLKLGELAYIEKETGDKPALLLDDIFSELDEEHRELVLNLVGKQQTIITTADGGVVRELEKIGKFGVVNKIGIL